MLSVARHGKHTMKDYWKRKSVLPVLICIVTILYITLYTRDAAIHRSVRLSLFRSYRTWLDYGIPYGTEILLNIALFIPFAFFLSVTLFCHDEKRPLLRVVLAGLLLSVCIETLQYLTGRGMADCDDLISNTLGTAAGFFAFRVTLYFSRKCASRICWIYTAAFFIALSFLGCVVAPASSRATTNIEDIQFRIEEIESSGDTLTLQGSCRFLHFKTPEYRIALMDEESGSLFPMETSVDGEHFVAKGTAEATKKYAISIMFRGYAAINSLLYIQERQLEYTGNVSCTPDIGGKDLEEKVQTWQLKAYDLHNDIFVYQSCQKLYWLIGTDIDAQTEIICHLHTNEPEKLPAGREQYGFDNIGFHPNGKAEITETMQCGRYRVFEREIPMQYPITLVRVGLHMNDKIGWTGYFRLTPIEPDLTAAAAY